MEQMPQNPYILLTPGPLSTTKTVKAVMMRDWCTWDDDYNAIVQDIRKRLIRMAGHQEGYTSVLMQGSGTFSVESVISTAVPENGKLLVLTNGAYGDRIAKIAKYHRISIAVNDSGEMAPPDPAHLLRSLETDPDISHVAVVHCETTTGMLNPVKTIGEIVKQHHKVYIVDAMSSFGGIPVNMAEIHADYLISSANKCIQGVPGFGFIIAGREILEKSKGQARSLSLDLYDQWYEMETKKGKWRFTSPTHTVRAFAQPLAELEEEGGVEKRYARYRENHRILVRGMRELGFQTLLADEHQSPFITSFISPNGGYEFLRFYHELKSRGFVIYPGKVTAMDTFRIGNIGDIGPDDIRNLLSAVKSSVFW